MVKFGSMPQYLGATTPWGSQENKPGIFFWNNLGFRGMVVVGEFSGEICDSIFFDQIWNNSPLKNETWKMILSSFGAR